MDNLSNGDSCASQIMTEPKEKKITKKETKADSEEKIKRIKYLEAEINFKAKQLEIKLNSLYELKSTKDTYDNIVTVRSIRIYEN